MLGYRDFKYSSSRPEPTLPTFLRIPRMVNLRRSALEHDFAAFGTRTLRRSLRVPFLRIPPTQPPFWMNKKISIKFNQCSGERAFFLNQD